MKKDVSSLKILNVALCSMLLIAFVVSFKTIAKANEIVNYNENYPMELTY